MTRSGPILLIEDNPDDIELTLRALSQNKVVNPVVVLTDGAQALAYLLRPGGPPETPLVILLDLKLPKVKGQEILKRLRAAPLTRLLPVVVLTTSREVQDIEECYTLGCNSYIRKPVDIDQFHAAMKQVGLYWLVLNEPPPPGTGG